MWFTPTKIWNGKKMYEQILCRALISLGNKVECFMNTFMGPQQLSLREEVVTALFSSHIFSQRLKALITDCSYKKKVRIICFPIHWMRFDSHPEREIDVGFHVHVYAIVTKTCLTNENNCNNVYSKRITISCLHINEKTVHK